MAGWPPERQVFVTVGTTEFDALIEAVDSDAAHAALAALGYTRVLFQVGRGSARPRGPAGSRSSRLPTACFDFAPSLDEHVGASALVISHAGAGSIMDALGRRKPLVVVANDALMDNHQTELADVRSSSERARSVFSSLSAHPRVCVSSRSSRHASYSREPAQELAERGHLLATTPRELAATLEAARRDESLSALKPYPTVDLDAFPRLVDEVTADISTARNPSGLVLPLALALGALALGIALS